MRIIGGRLRGRRLRGPRSHLIRPTSDRVREAIFSILGCYIEEAAVLDLFAGTGALGLEALSRGASFAVFVDRSLEAIQLIRRNVEQCQLENKADIICGVIPRVLFRMLRTGKLFDLVFMDPPYGKGYVKTILPLATQLTKIGGKLVVEHGETEKPVLNDSRWVYEDVRKYGDTVVSFLVVQRGVM